jgi:7,8-dihydropterin-6-yl-methyl-4-(beta-D-ribofuranosyl)aminobenzene 5'-phosphate synthase
MAGTLRITILKDNSSARADLYPGHGLAMLVEHGSSRVLLDAGPDDTTVANARTMGLDLRPLDAIVLSHGHYDHTGGLAAVLAEVGPVRVIAHPSVFEATYARDDGNLRYIGAPLSQGEYEALGARFEFAAEAVTVCAGLTTTGQVASAPTAEGPQTRLVRSGDAGLSADDFRDDLSLVAQLTGCSVLLTGCAHAGLSNILRHVTAKASGHPVRVVTGGLHLAAADDSVVAQVADEARAMGVETLAPCHCTGGAAVEVLKTRFDGRVVPVGTGSVVRVSEDGRVAVADAGALAAGVGIGTQQGM